MTAPAPRRCCPCPPPGQAAGMLLCDCPPTGDCVQFVRVYAADGTYTDIALGGGEYTPIPGGTVGACGADGTGRACESPTTPVAVTHLCLADGTPIAVVVQRDCDGTVSAPGWVDLTTGAYTTGPVPADAALCDATVTGPVAGSMGRIPMCDLLPDGTVVGFLRAIGADGTPTDTTLDGADYDPVGEVGLCDAIAAQAAQCAAPTTPLATTGLCLADGTPIATVSTRDCDGVITQDGWINLATGAFTTGLPPAGAVACGAGQSIQVSGVFCDTDPATGDVYALVLVEYTYDEDGAIENVRLVRADDGTTYELQGELSICPGTATAMDVQTEVLCLRDAAGELIQEVVAEYGYDTTTGERLFLRFTDPTSGAVVAPPAGAVAGVCGEPCQRCETLVLCHTPPDAGIPVPTSEAAVTVTAADVSESGVPPNQGNAIEVPLTDAASFFSGSAINLPAGAESEHAYMVGVVAVAPDCGDLDPAGSSELTISARIHNTGSNCGCGLWGRFTVWNTDTGPATNLGAGLAPPNQNGNLGVLGDAANASICPGDIWEPTRTITVPNAAIIAGTAKIELNVQTGHDGTPDGTGCPVNNPGGTTYTLDLFSATVAPVPVVNCTTPGDPGDPVPFLRQLCRACNDTVTVTDTELDGVTLYDTSTGTVGPCGPVSGALVSDRDLVQLCDTATDGTRAVFVRDYIRDTTGTITGHVDYTLDGTAEYLPSGEVGLCEGAVSADCAQVITTELCDFAAANLPVVPVEAVETDPTPWDVQTSMPAAANPHPDPTPLFEGTSISVTSPGATFSARQKSIQGVITPTAAPCGPPENVTVSVTMSWRNEGPSAGQGSDSALTLWNGMTQLDVATSNATPVGTTRTGTVDAVVPLADVQAGLISVRWVGDVSQNSLAMNWLLTGFEATVTGTEVIPECSEVTKFLRHTVVACADGSTVTTFDTTLAGAPYDPSDDVGECPAVANPCVHSESFELCDSTPVPVVLRATNTDSGPFQDMAGAREQVDTTQAELIWAGSTGELVASPTAGMHSFAAAVVSFDCEPCGDAETVTISGTLHGVNNGPTAAEAVYGRFSLWRNGVQVSGGQLSGGLAVDGEFTAALGPYTVPAADIRAGLVAVEFNLETNGDSDTEKSWTVDGFALTATAAAPGCGNRFLRTVVRNCAGQVVSTLDTLDGVSAYTPVPPVAVCTANPCSEHGDTCRTTTVLRLCDLNPTTEPNEAGLRCPVAFLRTVTYDCRGEVVATRDTTLDGITDYAAAEVVDCGTARSLREQLWETVSVAQDPADGTGATWIYTIANTEDPTQTGTVRMVASEPSSATCTTDPGQPQWNASVNFTFHPDATVLGLAHVLRVDALDWDTFEDKSMASTSPLPFKVESELGHTRLSDRTWRSLAPNNTGRFYFSGPPPLVSINNGNTGGGLACTYPAFAFITLVPGPPCDSCQVCETLELCDDIAPNPADRGWYSINDGSGPCWLNPDGTSGGPGGGPCTLPNGLVLDPAGGGWGNLYPTLDVLAVAVGGTIEVNAPAQLRFSVSIDPGVTMELPAGATPLSLSPNHTWDPATSRITGGPGANAEAEGDRSAFYVALTDSAEFRRTGGSGEIFIWDVEAAPAEPVTFLRKICRDCDGQVIGTPVDTLLDGVTEYVVQGTVRSCTVTGADLCVHCETLTLCDVPPLERVQGGTFASAASFADNWATAGPATWANAAGPDGAPGFVDFSAGVNAAGARIIQDVRNLTPGAVHQFSARFGDWAAGGANSPVARVQIFDGSGATLLDQTVTVSGVVSSGIQWPSSGEFGPVPVVATDDTMRIQITDMSVENAGQMDLLVDDVSLIAPPTQVPFLRTVCRGCDGKVVGAPADTTMDGITPYRVTGTIASCAVSGGGEDGGGETDVPLSTGVRRLTGDSPVQNLAAEFPGLQSVTLTVIAGEVTATMASGSAVVPAGVSLTWSVNDTDDSVLAAATFDGAAGSDYLAHWTHKPTAEG